MVPYKERIGFHGRAGRQRRYAAQLPAIQLCVHHSCTLCKHCFTDTIDSVHLRAVNQYVPS